MLVLDIFGLVGVKKFGIENIFFIVICGVMLDIVKIWGVDMMGVGDLIIVVDIEVVMIV